MEAFARGFETPAESVGQGCGRAPEGLEATLLPHAGGFDGGLVFQVERDCAVHLEARQGFKSSQDGLEVCVTTALLIPYLERAFEWQVLRRLPYHDLEVTRHDPPVHIGIEQLEIFRGKVHRYRLGFTWLKRHSLKAPELLDRR